MGEFTAESVTAGVAALALLVTGASLIYLARQTHAVAGQTREVAEQTRIGNAMAALSANTTVLGSLREVHLLILDRPGARRYFYDGEPLPEQQEQRDALITIAELLADVLATGLLAHSEIPGSASAQPWDRYCRHLLQSSPVLRDRVRDQPSWWPPLSELLPSIAQSAPVPTESVVA
jgi:hypothetical protein